MPDRCCLAVVISGSWLPGTNTIGASVQEAIISR
jgi:hypothetical protein